MSVLSSIGMILTRLPIVSHPNPGPVPSCLMSWKKRTLRLLESFEFGHPDSPNSNTSKKC